MGRGLATTGRFDGAPLEFPSGRGAAIYTILRAWPAFPASGTSEGLRLQARLPPQGGGLEPAAAMAVQGAGRREASHSRAETQHRRDVECVFM